MRQSTIVFILVASLLSLGLFLLKYEVQDLEHEIVRLNSAIVDNREAVHVLETEWSYLNDPARLAKLATQYLGLKAVTPSQISRLDRLPLPGEVSLEGALTASKEPRGTSRLTAKAISR